MADFFRKHTDKLRTAALVLMLLIPFTMYAAAAADSGLFLLLSLGSMALNMLLAMRTG